MNYNESHTDLFNAYLKRTLSDADLMAFEKRLKEDKELAEAFALHQLMVEGVKDHARAELKQFLANSANPATGKGKIIRFSNMQWAAAAVIVVIIGIYAVTQFYIQPKKDVELATKTQDYKIPEPENSSDSTYSPEKLEISDSVAPKESLSENAIVSAEPIIELDDAGSPPAIDNVLDKDVAMTEDSKGMEYDYNVLPEKKIKDTSVYLYNLPDLYAYENSKKDNNIYSNKKLSTAKLPANANSAPAQVERKDTSASKKKKSETSATKLQVEFWQSPVNFKGYKYWSNTVQLYGADQNSARLFRYNYQIYLRDNGKVYLLTPSVDATAYKPVVDESIIQLILSQK